MKVMISTDLEGISGIVDFSQITEGVLYEEARRLFVHDVNAAVEGALAGGATEIVVVDTHSLQLNLPLGDLHPRAQLISGGSRSHRKHLVMASLDDSFDVALLVGMHAAAHAPGGIIAHSYHLPSAFWEVRINGQPVGEPEIAAALAGAYGVPCGLITGDDVTIAEFMKILPTVEKAVVKTALDRTAARCLPLAETGPLITAAARRALERAAAREFEPWTFSSPCKLELVCGNYGIANKLASIPTAKRLDDRVVGFETDSYLDLYEALLISVYLAVASGDPA